MGNSIPIRCVPERALCLIESFCEDLYVSTCEFDNIKLRPSSRKTSSVLCVVWWKLDRIHSPSSCSSPDSSSCSFNITKHESRRARMFPYKVDDLLTVRHDMICCPDSGRCLGIISARFCNSTDNSGTLTWSINPYNLQNKGLIHHHPTPSHKSFKPHHWSTEIIAATDTHLLGVNWNVAQGTFSALSVASPEQQHRISPTVPPYSPGMIYGANFVQKGKSAVVVKAVPYNFGVDLIDEHGVDFIGTLGESDSTACHPLHHQAWSWGSLLIRETSRQFLFFVLFHLNLNTSSGSKPWCWSCRFIISEDRKSMVVVRRWTNWTFSQCPLSLIEFPASRQSVSLSEVSQPDNPIPSLILIRKRHSVLTTLSSMIFVWDRQTLEPLNPSIVCLPLPRRYFYNITTSTTKFEKDASVSVVAAGIRRSKEKRTRGAL